jgi:uncharacterized membrane protein YfcA
LTAAQAAFLFLAGALGGALNSVVGGGTFVVFPALLFAGVPAVAANATSTLALWPGGVASMLAYRKEIKLPRSSLIALTSASLVGGAIGAILLVRTPSHAFVSLVPWLLLFATTLFSFGGALSPRFRAHTREGHAAGRTFVAVAAVQFVIAIYGGYFGGGIGILMLATLALAGFSNIHEMNGVRTILTVLINGVAMLTFIFVRAIAWKPGLTMILGATIAGYFGAALARRIDPKHVKRFVLLVAWGMTLYFFFTTYRAT